MNVRLIAALSIFGLLFASSAVNADYGLSVRQQVNGDYEAVVSYSTSNLCIDLINQASSILIDGYDIAIESPEFTTDVPCIGTPIPPFNIIEQVANLGALAPDPARPGRLI